ncbi:MAG: hypothetical protein QOD77_1791 [Thermoplasmata archaeon]|jgi:hypothetical protein|nr:hypothetical protein [Thermoplasmata archaeon]
MRAFPLAAFALLATVLVVPAVAAQGPPTCTEQVGDVGLVCFDHNSHEFCAVYWMPITNGGCTEAGTGAVDIIIDYITRLA